MITRRASLIIVVALGATPWGCKQRAPAPATATTPAQKQKADVRKQIQPLMDRARGEANSELFQEAERLLEQAIKDAPQDDFFYAKLGRLLLDKWSSSARSQDNTHPVKSTPPARIKALLQKAIALNPGSTEAYVTLTQYYMSTQQFKKAVKCCKNLLDMTPGDAATSQMIATSYLQMNQPAQARTFFKNALQSKQAERDWKTKVAALNGLADVARMEGKYEEAERYYLKILAATKNPAPIICTHHSLGQLYAGMGRFKKGARFVQDMAKRSPHRGDIQLQAAMFSFLAYDFERAREHSHYALPLSNHRAGEVNNVLGFLLLLEQKYDAAANTFAKVLKANPSEPGAKVGKGHLAIINKDYPEARRLLSPYSLKQRPEHDDDGYTLVVTRMANLGMGWLLSNQGQHAQALKYFDSILSSHKDDLFALLGKGNTYIALGLLDQAEAVFKKVLEHSPGNQYGLAELGLVRLNKGDIEGAEEAFKQALAKGDQRYTCPYEGLGLVYLKKGKIARAKKYLEKAIAINPGIEYKKFNELAKIYIRRGKTEKAEKLLKKSIQNYPYDPEAKELLNKLQGAVPPAKPAGKKM